MKTSLDDQRLVRKLARDKFGPIIDLSDSEKETLRRALQGSQNVSLVECQIAANENFIEASTRQLLKLRAEILQDRMGDLMRAADELSTSRRG